MPSRQRAARARLERGSRIVGAGLRRYFKPQFENLESRCVLAFNIASAHVYEISGVLKLVADFNQAYETSSVQASDLKVDTSLVATGVNFPDSDTVEFLLPALGAGNHTLAIDLSTIQNFGSTEDLEAFNQSFLVASAAQYTVNQNPRLQPGNAPLVGYAGSELDRVDILWQTVSAGAGSDDTFTVEYRAVGGGNWNSAALNTAIDTTVGGRFVRSASITGLNWNSDYEYRVRHLRGSVIEGEYASQFHTRLAAGDTSSFSFAAYGDSAKIVSGEVTGFRDVQARINQVNPAFAVLLGDNVYEAGSHAESDARFDSLKNPEAAEWMASHIDYLGLGNHDIGTSSGLPSEQNYSVPIPVAGVTAPAAPAGETAAHNFSWDYGSVHFVTFDSNSLSSPTRLNTQLNWVLADLAASTARWKIVYAHHPVAGAPDKLEDGGDNYYQQVVNRLKAAGVDLFLTGHSHTYAWTYPLTGQINGTETYVNHGVNDEFHSSEGLVQVISGVGGKEVRDDPFDPTNTFVAAGYNLSTTPVGRLGFSKVDVTQNALTISYVAADNGEVIDSFVIEKEPLTTVSFQQGVNGYSGTVDTYLLEGSTASNAGAAAINVDNDAGSGADAQGLLRFENIFGTGDGQIPTNATIRSATLQLNVINGSTNNNMEVHRMVASWAATDLWTTFGAGIQANDTEGVTAADTSSGLTPTAQTLSFNVLASLLAWQASPTSNKGWVLLPTGADGVDFDSAEGTLKPKLIVAFDTLPTISDITNKSTAQNTPTSAIPFTVDDPESVPGALTVSAISSNTTLVPNANLSLGGSGASRTITATPASGQAGTTTITVTVIDESGMTAFDTFDLTVTAPEIQVLDGGADIADGAGSISFGSTLTGAPLSKTFTITNSGNQAILLTSAPTLPSGFSVSSSYSSTTIAPGDSSTFTIRLDASAAGSYSGTLSFDNNDDNENPFNFTISGTVVAPATLSGTLFNDFNGNGTYQSGTEGLLANWTVYLDTNKNGQFDGGEVSTQTNASGQYTFSNLWPGTYVVGNVAAAGYRHTSPTTAYTPPGGFPSDPYGSKVVKLSQVGVNQFAGDSQRAADIATYVSPSGREYALIGLQKGTGIVDVTNPTAPVIRATVPGGEEAGGLGGSLIVANHEEEPGGEASIWREVAVYGHYAYTVTEAGSGIQVIDLANIDSNVANIVNGGNQIGPSTSHTVRVNSASGYLYLMGSSGFGGATGGGLQVFSLANPAAPAFVGQWSGHYVHDAVPYSYTSGPMAGREIVYAFASHHGVKVLDVTNKANIVELADIVYPNVTYAHYGALSEDLNYLYINDELDETNTAVSVDTSTTYVANVANPASPFYVTSFTNGNSAIDHNPMVRGHYIYEANYTSGLRIYDIANPLSAREVGWYDTYSPNDNQTFAGAWGVDASLPSGIVVVSDISSGLIVLDPGPAVGPASTFKVSVAAGQNVSGLLFGNQEAEPEIQVLDGNTNIADEAGSVSFGSTPAGIPVSKTFTVRNTGTLDLNLTSPPSLPPGFTLTSGYINTTLAPNAITTFTVRLDAAAMGSYSGTLSFDNDDADENPFNFTISGTVVNPLRYIDDGDAGFSTVGTWSVAADQGYLNDVRYTAAGTGTRTATWTSSGLPSGMYRVSATWFAHANRATNAPYTVLDGSTTVGTVGVNQELAPSDLTDAGVGWKDLGTFAISSGALVVRLTNNANEYVIADGIRLERTGDIVLAAEIQVLDGASDIADGTGTAGFGSTFVGSPVSKTFTVRNNGTQTLNLTSQPTLPAGFTLTSGFSSLPLQLAPSVTATFTVRLDATAIGNYSGQLSFGNDDADENPFNFTISGTVAANSVLRYIDNGDAGYSTTGSWSLFIGQGYLNDVHSTAAGNGSNIATWTSSGLPSGMYRVSATWFAHANRATNAPYTVLDGSTTVGTVGVNQELAPSDLTDAGVGWKDLGTFAISSGALVVRLTNNANEYVIADGIRLERTGDIVLAAEIQVLDGASDIADGTGTAGFGSTFVGSPVSKTFTVRNNGTQTLNLTSQPTLPAGFTLTSGFSSLPLQLAPSATATFTVRLDATAIGNYSGQLSFGNDDADENPFNFTISGTVAANSVLRYIDNGDAGYSTTGSWSLFIGQGYLNDVHSTAAGNGSNIATWTSSGLPSGMYRVSATWFAHANRATNAPYTVLDGSTTVGTVGVNQELAPSDLTDAGVGWKDLGTFAISSGALVVRLTNNANEYVIADGIRLERTGDIVLAAEIQVLDGASDIADGTGTAGFGSTFVGSPVSKTFTVRNNGTQTLNLTSQPTLPAGFTLTSGFSSLPLQLAPSATATFTVRLDATAIGNYSGQLSFGNDDADENPFNFTISGTVTAISVLQYIDNGDAGFSTTGSWSSFTGQGYLNDVHYTAAGNGSNIATWTSSSLPPGMYRVSATWSTHTNRATNAPYTVLDGTTTRASATINQEQAPNDFTAAGVAWEDLGASLAISSGTLVVRLTNNANEYVIADAVRIERLGDLVLEPEIQVQDGSANVADNSGSVSFGSTLVGVEVSKTFTVMNTGNQPLVLSTPISVPSGFSVTNSFGTTTLAPNATTTFTVRLDATVSGNFSGTLSFATNDADENPFNFTISGAVTPLVTVAIIDNGDSGFATTGSWTYQANPVLPGYQTDTHFATAGTGSNVATWTFAGLSAGMYRVSTTWTASTTRASNAPYTVLDGTTTLVSATINQEQSPNDFTASGVYWEDFGTLLYVSSGTLLVRLTNNANDVVLADAVRIERVGDSLGIKTLSAIMSENGGTISGVVVRSSNPASDQVVTLWSSDTSEATVPVTVTIPANASSAPFTISAANDGLVDHAQAVTIQASAAGLGTSEARLHVLDDEGINLLLNIGDGPGEGFYDSVLGADRRNAFEFALDIWENLLPTSYANELITVDAAFNPLGSNVLGSAGPRYIWDESDMGAAALPDTWYVDALANHLVGFDLNPGVSEIAAQFSSDFSFYYGLDGGHIDFVTVVLHEIGHGLNILDLGNPDGTWIGFGVSGVPQQPGIYDRFLQLGNGTDLVGMTTTARAAAFVSDDVYWNGAGGMAGNSGTRPKIYAPSTYSNGSSIGHLDETVHRFELMSPSYSSVDHAVSAMELGMLTDMGWTASGGGGGGGGGGSLLGGGGNATSHRLAFKKDDLDLATSNKAVSAPPWIGHWMGERSALVRLAAAQRAEAVAESNADLALEQLLSLVRTSAAGSAADDRSFWTAYLATEAEADDGDNWRPDWEATLGELALDQARPHRIRPA